jgi:hypothetical protein
VSVFFYLIFLTVVLAAAWDTGFSGREMTVAGLIIFLFLSIITGILLVASLVGIISYFIFLSSISRDSHLFLQAHASHLIHPLQTSLILGLAALCVFTRSPAGWAVWAVLVAFHGFQTFLVSKRVRREQPIGGPGDSAEGSLLPVINRILGTEVVTAASGVKSLSPWRLDRLPENPGSSTSEPRRSFKLPRPG